MGKIYKELGILSDGKMIETDRSGLVAGYVGQTAMKVHDVVKEAMGGILFIDEAYSLVKQINGFGDAVKDAADKNDPFYINRYVTNLTKSFNKFYNTNPIMKDDVDEETKKARLAIVDATTKVIKTALGLLGIETVESM